MALVDAVPRPQPLPLEARRQFTETRDILDRLESHFRALLDQKEAQLRSPDRDNLRRYAEANQKISPPLPGRPRAVFLGDSITDGWPVNEYFPDRDFLNRGIGGQVTSEMLGRMKADVIDLKARVLLVLAGTNDIARGAPVKTIQNNLSMIADLADRNNVRPLFASVLPVSDYHQRVNPSFLRTTARPPSTILELNRWIQSFCAQRGYLYVDYFKAMVDASGHLRAELADDGLHPNSAGYRVMAPIALAAIEKELASGVSKRAAAKGSGLDPAAPEKKTKPGAQALRQH
ncbi:MAG: capsular biosynthesis protein [Acidobacteria bacterium]|nr:capsular biosynthesis protein [Acidobacteriota bacterium]